MKKTSNNKLNNEGEDPPQFTAKYSFQVGHIVKLNWQNKKHNKQSSTCSNGNSYSSKLCCLLQKTNRGRNPFIFAFNGQYFLSLKYLLQHWFMCIRLMERLCVVIKTLSHTTGVYFEKYKRETPPSGSGKLTSVINPL